MPRVYTMAEAQAGGVDNFWCDSNGCYDRRESPPTSWTVTGQDPVRRRLEVDPNALALSQKLEKPVGTAERAYAEFYTGGRMPVVETGFNWRGVLGNIGTAVLGGVQTGVEQFASNVTGNAAACARLILRPVEYAMCLAKAQGVPIPVPGQGGPTFPGAFPCGGPGNPPCLNAPGSPGTAVLPAGPTGASIFGIPAMRPTAVSRTRLVCPRGLILGSDNLCYTKGSIPRKYRKWKPDARPPLTAGDAKAIKRAAGAKRRVRKLAGAVGLTTHARGAHAGPQKGPRRK